MTLFFGILAYIAIGVLVGRIYLRWFSERSYYVLTREAKEQDATLVAFSWPAAVPFGILCAVVKVFHWLVTIGTRQEDK